MNANKTLIGIIIDRSSFMSAPVTRSRTSGSGI